MYLHTYTHSDIHIHIYASILHTHRTRRCWALLWRLTVCLSVSCWHQWHISLILYAQHQSCVSAINFAVFTQFLVVFTWFGIVFVVLLVDGCLVFWFLASLKYFMWLFVFVFCSRNSIEWFLLVNVPDFSTFVPPLTKFQTQWLSASAVGGRADGFCWICWIIICFSVVKWNKVPTSSTILSYIESLYTHTLQRL